MAVALVTGAAGVLGRAVAKAFADRGDVVVAVERSEDSLRELEGEIPGVRLQVADVTRPQDVDELWERIDQIGEPPEHVANLVGGYRGGEVVETSPDDFRFMQDLNLAATWWSNRAAARRMKAAGRGSIVNVAARTALVGGAGSAAYAVAKSGVVKLTEVLAEELKDHGVRVNAVLPALIDTPANRDSYPAERMARAVSPEAIARVIAFLCSDDAVPITGAAIPIYGRY